MKKKNLYIFTLEPIEKRYTKQWYKHWKKDFLKFYDKVTYIDGVIGSDKIEKGKFLDINKTNIWKAQQVEKVATLFNQEKIKEGDTFIFEDGWHFGITALKYMTQLNNIKTKIYAYWHAGTWDKEDFISQAGLGKWAPLNEGGWLLACDGHFVATKFHKDLIVDYFTENDKSLWRELNSKIHVVGFPMDWDAVINKDFKNKGISNYKDLVVFPHRVDPEKCPEVFDNLSKQLPKYEFIKTMEVTKNKKEYYKILSEAKIIFSANKQETFGIGTVEAMMLGCIPVVPDKLAYRELYHRIFRYADIYEAKQKINYFMNKKNKGKVLKKILEENIEKIKNQSLNSIKKMAEVMQR